MSNASSNVLKKNNSSWAIFSILNNTKLCGKRVVAWRIVSGEKITAEVFIRVIRKSRNEILLRGADPVNQKILATLSSGSDRINLFLPEDMVLFQSEIKSFDSVGDATLRVPEMIAQIDRRKHMRLFLGGEIGAQVKFFKKTHAQTGNTQLFDKHCFDISAGGLSFIVSKMEGKFFMTGDEIEMVRIFVENREIKVSGKVVNIQDIEPDDRNQLHYKGRKICVRYSKIGPNDQKLLDDFVFRHADLSEAI